MKKLEIWGAVVTGAYLVTLAVLVWTRWPSFSSLALNELGDFLAGAFGPVAFFWLVLGFLQQGRELRLTSEALQLQVKELNQSVEQQTIMARAATDQIKSQKAALDIQIWQHEQSLSPLFEVQIFPTKGPDSFGATSFVARLTNRGAVVDSISMLIAPPLGDGQAIVVGRLSNLGVSEDLGFSCESLSRGLVGVLNLEYLRSDGVVKTSEFTYVAHSSGRVDVSRVVTRSSP